MSTPTDRQNRGGKFCSNLCSQFVILLRKNLAVHKHNSSTTLMQIFLPWVMRTRHPPPSLELALSAVWAAYFTARGAARFFLPFYSL